MFEVYFKLNISCWRKLIRQLRNKNIVKFVSDWLKFCRCFNCISLLDNFLCKQLEALFTRKQRGSLH